MKSARARTSRGVAIFRSWPEFSCCIFRDQAGIFRDPAAAAPGELQKHRFRSILSPIFEQILTLCANRPDRSLPGGTVGTNVDVQELEQNFD